MPSAPPPQLKPTTTFVSLFSKAYKPEPHPPGSKLVLFYPTLFRTKGKVFAQSTVTRMVSFHPTPEGKFRDSLA